ncbi:autotransporter assembly complex protein TamA [Allosphingosinicella indica]|nr:BamA/TamA family outer membrane protein [Allosphingosinicella indica]
MLALAASAAAALPADPPETDAPIVSDREFEAALPPLDAELGAPLEPIENFDAGLPPATDAAPDVALPQPPVVPLDPALAEPLPPLATFDVTTPEASPEDSEEAPPVRYTLAIEGLKDVGLQGRFRDLSALEQGDNKATNGAMVAARAREDEALAVRLLRSEGYYDGTAVVAIEQLPDQPGQLRVTVTAAPGERYNLGEIAVTGPETVPPGLAREALPLKTGSPIVAAEVEGAEANVALKLPQQGYPFTQIGQRDVLLDPVTHIGDYTLPVDPGPRARFGGFTTEGDLAFDAEHVGVLSRFERGDLYDSRKVDDLREAMVATSLFSSVSAEPVRTGEQAEDGTEYVNILVRQDAGPPRALTATAGYATGEGFRVEGAWEHRNLFPPEGALRFGAIAGTQEQSARATFRRSNAGKRDRTVVVNLEAGRRDYPAYTGYTARLNGLISRESTPIWQKRWTWAYGAELIATNENAFDTGLLARERQTYFIGGLTGQLGYDASDSLLDPTKGFRLLGRVNPEVSLNDGTRPYVRNLIEGSAYFPASDSIVLAGRVRFGSISGIDRDDLAPSRRLYAGGGGSVRGFGYQELGPKDLDNNPIGGRSLNEFALEARYRFGNYGVVGFVDAGQVYSSALPQFSNLRYGVGVGGRFYTNFGPMRLDVAMPIDRQPGESKFAVYISIGQAF